MMGAFASDATVDLRRFLFRFVDFLVRIWVLYALFRLTLPVPVILNLFLELLWLFNFGIDKTSFALYLPKKITLDALYFSKWAIAISLSPGRT
jgi:hypothetical protein